MTLVEFLLARIAEVEEAARRSTDLGDMESLWYPDTILADCEAKRRIIGLHEPGGQYVWGDGPACSTCGDVVTVQWPCDTLRTLALPYADHRDYQPEWRP